MSRLSKRIIWLTVCVLMPLAAQAASVPVAQIKKAVETSIRQRMPWKNEDVTIGPIQFDDSIELPAGRLTFTLTPNPHEDYLGRSVMALQLFVDGQPVRRMWVNTSISVMADVVTVVRPLGNAQSIQASDLTIQRRDLKDLPNDALRSINAVVGNRTTCAIYPQTVLQANMVESPPLVRRGDMVKIVAHSGSLTITATGLVKQKGARDEIIRVMNTSSNRVIAARVKEPGVVEVDF